MQWTLFSHWVLFISTSKFASRGVLYILGAASMRKRLLLECGLYYRAALIGENTVVIYWSLYFTWLLFLCWLLIQTDVGSPSILFPHVSPRKLVKNALRMFEAQLWSKYKNVEPGWKDHLSCKKACIWGRLKRLVFQRGLKSRFHASLSHKLRPGLKFMFTSSLSNDAGCQIDLSLKDAF